MIKVLIIDDEPLVRMGMNSIIAWEEHGYKIVGEAGNGVQGLEKIREYRPDLVLIDIMMPQMDGLTVIEESRKEGFAGKFIILSCVSEIEYLQKAIRLGVSSYVLKSSVNPQEILETVEEAAAEIKKEKRVPMDLTEDFGKDFRKNSDHFGFREFLNLILKGIVTEPGELGEKMQVFGYDRNKKAYLLVSSIQETGMDYRKLLYKMASVGESLLEERWGTCFANFEDYLVILMSAVSGKEAEEIAFRMKASASQYFDIKLRIQIRGIDLQEWNIASQYEDAKEELAGSFFENKEKKEDAELIPSTEFASYKKLSAALEMIKSMLLQSRAVTESEAKKVYAGAIEYVILIYELAWEEDIKKELKGAASIPEYLMRMDSFEQVHKETLRVLRKCYELAEQKGYREYEDELTDTMVKYIHSRCNSKISTKDVAEHVHFSVDYTCKYFKKKTQTNLTDYILKLKIYRSHKELLEGKSIAEIADIYGFSSGGHYLKVFKKYEGMTPGAFVRNSRTDNKSGI